MKEPFKRIDKDVEILDDDGDPIPIFSISRFSSCDWNHYCDITEEYAKPLTDELSEIFDLGNEIHEEDEELTRGSRNIIGCEEYMRIIHESERYGLSGLLDYHKYNFHTAYIEDLKSTSKGGFYFFLREGVNNDYKKQLSGYAYLKYIHTGVWRNIGVITKIDKENPLNRISLSTELFTKEQMRDFYACHPVILAKLGDITEEKLINICAQKIIRENEKDPLKWWKCRNCQYNEGCPVRQEIQEVVG